MVTQYEIRQTNTTFTKGVKLKPRKGQVNSTAGMCPPGEYVTGIDARGELTCSKAVRSVYSDQCASGAGYGITNRAEMKCAEITDYCKKDLALAVVVDRSGSMAEENKLADAKTSVNQFLDRLLVRDVTGLASFAEGATLEQELDADKTRSKQRLGSIIPNGGTNMTSGFEQASQMLAGADPTLAKGIIFISDGWHNHGASPTTIVTKLKADGIKIWTIGFGKEADTVTLSRLATSPDYFTYAKDATSLDEAYKKIADHVCR